MAATEIPLADYSSRLLSRVEVAEGTMAFHFEKPSQFDFKPGQSADVTLSSPPETDSEGNTRTFSIASPPFENQLIFATRIRDTAFKRSLKKVPLGTEVKIDSTMGSFTLHRIQPGQLCSWPGESESLPFSASWDKPTTTGSHTGCISSIPTGDRKIHLFSKLFRCWKRAILIST